MTDLYFTMPSTALGEGTYRLTYGKKGGGKGGSEDRLRRGGVQMCIRKKRGQTLDDLHNFYIFSELQRSYMYIYIYIYL